MIVQSLVKIVVLSAACAVDSLYRAEALVSAGESYATKFAEVVTSVGGVDGGGVDGVGESST